MLPDDGAAQKPPRSRFKDMGKAHLQETSRGKTSTNEAADCQEPQLGSSSPAGVAMGPPYVGRREDTARQRRELPAVPGGVTRFCRPPVPCPRLGPSQRPAHLPPARDGAATQPSRTHGLHRCDGTSHQPPAEDISSFSLQPDEPEPRGPGQAAASQSRWPMAKRGRSRRLLAESPAPQPWERSMRPGSRNTSVGSQTAPQRGKHPLEGVCHSQ